MQSRETHKNSQPRTNLTPSVCHPKLNLYNVQGAKAKLPNLEKVGSDKIKSFSSHGNMSTYIQAFNKDLFGPSRGTKVVTSSPYTTSSHCTCTFKFCLRTLALWVCLNFLVSCIQDYNVRNGKGDFIIALFMSMEFTNPFLSMAIILKTVSINIS